MKITRPDGTVLEGEIDDLVMYEQALTAARTELAPTCEGIVPEDPAKTHIDVPLAYRPEDPAHIPLRRLPGEPRKGVSRHIAVTQAQRQALAVMRRNPTQEWTAIMVGESSGLRGDALEAIKAAVSRMCRDERGVVQGHNNVFYLLDEFGRYAIPHVFARPGYKWGSMKQAWEEGREWNDPREQAEPDVIANSA
jgi:hypothetical protein